MHRCVLHLRAQNTRLVAEKHTANKRYVLDTYSTILLDNVIVREPFAVFVCKKDTGEMSSCYWNKCKTLLIRKLKFLKNLKVCICEELPSISFEKTGGLPPPAWHPLHYNVRKFISLKELFSYVMFDIHYVECINPKKEVLSCQALVIQIDKTSIM